MEVKVPVSYASRISDSTLKEASSYGGCVASLKSSVSMELLNSRVRKKKGFLYFLCFFRTSGCLIVWH